MTSTVAGYTATQSEVATPGFGALAEQLDAAVSDCWAAWESLKYGDQPSSAEKAPVMADRQARIHMQVARLAELAREIRSRA